MCDSILEDWSDLDKQYKQLEAANEEYVQKLQELHVQQDLNLKYIAYQRHKIGQITKNLKKLESEKNVYHAEKINEIKNEIQKREIDLQNIEATLPRSGGKYLRIVLGNIDVSFLNKEAKYKYKDDYEKFKLISHVICFVVVLLNLQYPTRVVELAHFFFLVWYYCTLTIREAILKVNGSRIKGWWRIHHVLSAVASGILLIWPDNPIWHEFRYQFFLYTIYNCLLQYLQFKYQNGTLYRLKALGKRDNMDITIEGFHSWMWRGLTFMLPFLFFGYLLQLLNAIRLYRLTYFYSYTWHVPVLIGLFSLFAAGNFITTLLVVPDKIKKKMINQYRIMTKWSNYSSLGLGSLVKTK